jgi:nickel-dependent lactate racemase
MKPRKNSDGAEKTAAKVTPFSKITAVEETEEGRANRMVAAIEREADEALKAIERWKRQEEENMQEAALAEVRRYAEKEPNVILSRTLLEMQEELAAIESSFRTHGKKIAATLADSMLDFTSLTRS